MGLLWGRGCERTETRPVSTGGHATSGGGTATPPSPRVSPVPISTPTDPGPDRRSGSSTSPDSPTPPLCLSGRLVSRSPPSPSRNHVPSTSPTQARHLPVHPHPTVPDRPTVEPTPTRPQFRRRRGPKELRTRVLLTRTPTRTWTVEGPGQTSHPDRGRTLTAPRLCTTVVSE